MNDPSVLQCVPASLGSPALLTFSKGCLQLKVQGQLSNCLSNVLCCISNDYHVFLKRSLNSTVNISVLHIEFLNKVRSISLHHSYKC